VVGSGSATQIARHLALERQVSQDAGEITATLKLRRRTCGQRFGEEIDGLYADWLAGRRHRPQVGHQRRGPLTAGGPLTAARSLAMLARTLFGITE